MGVLTTWETGVAEQIRANAAARPADAAAHGPYLVAVAGIPGSGKTTSSSVLAGLLPEAIVIPFDGFHYYRKELLAMEDPDQKMYWRGAPETFNAELYRTKLQAVAGVGLGSSTEGEGEAAPAKVEFPAFDHATADPEEGAVVFERSKQIVIVEGIYTLLDTDKWAGLPLLYNLKIFVDSDIEKCIARLKIRNRCIPGYT